MISCQIAGLNRIFTLYVDVRMISRILRLCFSDLVAHFLF